MEHESADYVAIIQGMRPALEEDWKNQREQGYRDKAISFSRLNRQLPICRPIIGRNKSFFKTNYIYHRINQQDNETIRTIPLYKLIAVLDFLYLDLSTPYGWPELTKFLQNYKRGKYAQLVEKYEDQVFVGGEKKTVEAVLDNCDLSCRSDTVNLKVKGIEALIDEIKVLLTAANKLAHGKNNF